MAKISNYEANNNVEEYERKLEQLKIKLDDMYDKLNTTLYKKNIATKVSYSEVNPFDLVSRKL